MQKKGYTVYWLSLYWSTKIGACTQVKIFYLWYYFNIMNRIKIIFLCVNMHMFVHAYESGFDGAGIQWRPLRESCRQQIKQAAGDALQETHCKKTAEYIIKMLINAWDIQQQKTVYCDMADLLNERSYTSLFASNADYEHMIFLVNICGSGHVCVIEKKAVGSVVKWRIFQSWQNQFTLAQWLGLDFWERGAFEHDYAGAGAGKCITKEAVIHFLKTCIAVCAGRMQQFKACGIPLPYELEITEFRV